MQKTMNDLPTFEVAQRVNKRMAFPISSAQYEITKAERDYEDGMLSAEDWIKIVSSAVNITAQVLEEELDYELNKG